MTRKRLWMNRISGIVCLLLWIALVIFLSGTTGKIAGMALGIMLLVAVIYNLYLPKEVSTHDYSCLCAKGRKNYRTTLYQQYRSVPCFIWESFFTGKEDD